LDAPFAYKTTNISVLGLFIGDGGLQESLLPMVRMVLSSTSTASMIERM